MLFSCRTKASVVNIVITLSLCVAYATGVDAQVSTAQDAPPPVQTPAKMPYARMSGSIMSTLRLKYVAPVYPPEAMATHTEGTVVLHVVVVNGIVANVEAISGPEVLRQSAIDAVKQWTYKPLLLHGQPAQVDTTVTINFTLQRSQP